MTPAEVIRELRRRQRLHDAALLAEQENTDAKVLAEHRAATCDPYDPANAPFRSFGRAPTNEDR